MSRKIVLDTNCLVQMVPADSCYRPAWQTFLQGGYTLCVSDEILNEYQEILERLTSAGYARYIVNAIVRSPHTRYYAPHFHFRLIEQDPDDNKFVDCAIIAGASFIVSDDAHFRVLKQIRFPTVRVLCLDEFMQEIEQG